MENYKKAAAIITIMTIIFTAGISSNYASADEYGNSDNSTQEEVLMTIESNDYESWKKIISGRSEIASMISEQDFGEFIKARQAARNGEYDKAIEIATALEDALSGKFRK